LASADGTEPPAGRITVSQRGNEVIVRTYTASGEPDYIGFNLIVAC
jgi:hypothetical protein